MANISNDVAEREATKFRDLGGTASMGVTMDTLIAGEDLTNNVMRQDIRMAGGTTITAAATLADSTANPTTYPVAGMTHVFNGTSFDRQRGAYDTGILINAAGATATQTTSDLPNYNHKGIIVVLDMTTVGTGSVTLEIDGKDTASGKYYAILTGAAVTTNSTNVYTIYPGLTAVANVTANNVLPRTWRIKVTANNANATTYTVGASVIL